MINSPKIRAYKFLLTDFSNDRLNLQGVIKALEKKGYEIIPFSRVNIGSEILMLAQKMDAENLIKKKDCVFCVKNGIKIIFINDCLTENDKFIILLHELGHANDRDIESAFRTKVQNEDYANEFSHYLRRPGAIFLLFINLIRYKAAVFAILLIAISGAFCYNAVQNTRHEAVNAIEDNLSDEFFYVTAHGKKYHRSDCRHIKNYSDLHKIPQNNADILSIYKPCLDCIGE